MQTQWAIFFDLDETLVFTSAILSLRAQKNWSQVYASLHLTTLPPGTTTFLEQIRAWATLGVITSAPRGYAERLLAYHHLALPVVAAYWDTRLHKPHPAPLLYAAQQVGLAPEHCLYIGDDGNDLLAAHAAKMVPIGLSWNGSLRKHPAACRACAMCAHWEEVRVCLQRVLKREEGENSGDL